MTVTALEVSLNGKVLYTVGMKDWAMLGATVRGIRQTQEMMEHIIAHSPADLPPEYKVDQLEYLNLHCHVGVPDSGTSGGSKGQGYGMHKLNVGDTVTIRVVKSDDPDKPLPPSNAGGVRIVSSK